MRKARKLLVAALGATTLTFGCTKVYGNPKGPPIDPPDAPIDSAHPDGAHPDGGLPDAGVDAVLPDSSIIPDAQVPVEHQAT